MFPYLLRHLVIDRPNQVWAADVTYIPMERGFVYLVAVIDWFSRDILVSDIGMPQMNGDQLVRHVRTAMNIDGGKRILQVQLVDPPHQRQIRVADRPRQVVHATAADPERLGLPGDRQIVPRGRSSLCAQQAGFAERAF